MYGAVQGLTSLLDSSSDDVRLQAFWALGNIAADSPRHRDFVLSHNVLEPLLQQMGEGACIFKLRRAVWTLSRLCMGSPGPSLSFVQRALPALARIINHSDEGVLGDACRALSFLSDGDSDRIAKLIEAGVCNRLAKLLLFDSAVVVVPAMQTVRKLVSRDDVQTQTIVDFNVLPCLLALLCTSTHARNIFRQNIKKEACAAISHITAGTRDQIQAVIDAGLIPHIVQLAATGEHCFKGAAARAVRIAVTSGTAEQVRYLTSQACIKPLCELMSSASQAVAADATEALQGILQVGEQLRQLPGSNGHNPYAKAIMDATGSAEVLDRLAVVQAGAGPSSAPSQDAADRPAAKKRRLSEPPTSPTPPAAPSSPPAAVGPSQQQQQQRGSIMLPLVMDLSATSTSSSGPFVVVRVRGDNPLVARYRAAADALAGGQLHPLVAVDIDMAVRDGDGECVAVRVPFSAVQQLYVAAQPAAAS